MTLSKAHSDPSRYLFLEHIKKSVRQDGRIIVRNFGTFKIVKKKARAQRLPSGKIIQIPARSVVKFLPSKNFLKQ